MKVIILAGGTGKRLAIDENSLPKPLSDIGGKPLLWHIMKYFAHYGIDDFILCLGYKGDLIREKMSGISEISDEEWNVNFLDTGVASSKLSRIEQSVEYLDKGMNMLAYADNLCDFNISAFIKHHEKSGKLLTLAGVMPHSPYGHIFRDNGQITFKEKPLMMNSLINAGFMLFEPGFLKYVRRNHGELETDVISLLAKNNELNVFEHSGNWNGINNMKEYEIVLDLYKSGKAYWEIWTK